MFDKNLAAKIHSNKQGYIECLSEPGQKKRKKASSFKFLDSIMMKIKLKRKLISWKDIDQSNVFHESIIFVSSRAKYFSSAHIITICGGWIFYGNLNYAILLSEESLN